MQNILYNSKEHKQNDTEKIGSMVDGWTLYLKEKTKSLKKMLLKNETQRTAKGATQK